MTKTQNSKQASGFTFCKDTVKKLAEMKSKLQFQPGYFSGSKVDFLERMEFIAKMTRPARNSLSEKTGAGFSF